jgi:hypothetical protein
MISGVLPHQMDCAGIGWPLSSKGMTQTHLCNPFGAGVDGGGALLTSVAYFFKYTWLLSPTLRAVFYILFIVNLHKFPGTMDFTTLSGRWLTVCYQLDF